MKRTYHPTQDFRNGSQDIIPASKTRIFENEHSHKFESREIETYNIPSQFQKFDEASSNIKVENITSSQVKVESNILDTKMDIDDIYSSDVKEDDMMNIDSLSNQQTIPNEHELNMNELFSAEIQNRIHSLRRFTKLLPYMDDANKKILFDHLRKLLYNEQDKDVKILVIILLGKLALDPIINCGTVLEDFMNQMESNSTELKCRIYDTIIKILQTRFESILQMPKLKDTLKFLCIKVTNELTDSHYSIRSSCISLLASLAPIIKLMQGQTKFTEQEYLNETQIQTIIHDFGKDSDPRVRSSALKSLLQLHNCGYKLDLSLYSLCVACLTDDYEEVRIEALSLIWVLSSLYSERTMQLDDRSTQVLRLIDDAFIKICDMVCDESVKVRSKACNIMGSYKLVEDSILLSTLSQQVISHGKPRKPMFKKSRYIPTPEGDIDVESTEFRLLKSSANGAFIHGLEDAFQDVRNAAIDSICELSMHNQKFSKRAVEFLVDMFQDEIDFVRLNSIISLRKIGTLQPIELDSELLQITLSVLNDADPIVRESTHGMLGVARITSPELIPSFIKDLLASMSRYPEDQLSIYQCFREFGSVHGEYIEKFIPKFFKMESSYISKEINQNAPEHIGNLILAFNASVSNPKILSILPKYAFRHYEYLRDKFPNCFPEVKIPGDAPRQSIRINADDNTQLFMNQTIKMVFSMGNFFKTGDFKAALRVAKVCTNNLKYISHVPSLSGNAIFIIMYLDCVKIIIQIKQNYLEANSFTTAVDTAARLLSLSYIMEHRLIGLSVTSKTFVVYLRVLANIVWIFGCLIDANNSQVLPLLSKKGLLKSFIKRVSDLQKKFERDNFLSKDLGKLQTKLNKASISPTIENIMSLFDYIMDYNLIDIDLSDDVKRSEATIIKPVSNPDQPLEFQSEFPFTINIEAELRNVIDATSVAVQVIFPDQTIEHFRPPSADFVVTETDKLHLRTQIDISQPAWTESCYIQLKIVRDFEPDIPEMDQHIMRQCVNGNIYGSTYEKTIDLSEPVKYHIWPRDLLSKRIR
ncbi:armadillo-type protein [Glomus cerebriforme]|uniref:Armadillo-type protein n=1 Tax=Glomus cerebriforme TaxID=658196 RepID=A0A397TIY1_9GLOM|nr:armadillo-type protein [Glomus cerebriforme]